MHDIWNPWHGCTKCSPGCKNCYMYFLDNARGVNYQSDTVFRTKNFGYPLAKTRNKQFKVKSGERIRVNMTSDTFVEEADCWRDEMWDIVRQRKDVIFWFLTKRPERIKDHLPFDWEDGYDNVSMNVTCENQDMFDKRIDYLLDLPAKHKGLCLSPLISDIDITKAAKSGQIEEISVGGENYGNPRPCDFAWVKHISDVCREYQVNFYWYETGTNFWMDGKQYWMPSKQKQSTEAYFAGLNQHYYDIVFDLYDENGQKLENDVLYHKVYNLNHCLFCANQDMCNGCSRCGNCGGNERIIDERQFVRVQKEILCRQFDSCDNVQSSINAVNANGCFDLISYYSGY